MFPRIILMKILFIIFRMMNPTVHISMFGGYITIFLGMYFYPIYLNENVVLVDRYSCARSLEIIRKLWGDFSAEIGLIFFFKEIKLYLIK